MVDIAVVIVLGITVEMILGIVVGVIIYVLQCKVRGAHGSACIKYTLGHWKFSHTMKISRIF